MSTRTKTIIDWVLLIIFCAFLFSTLHILPVIWEVSAIILEEDVGYIPALFISSIMFFLLFYTIFFKEQRRLSSYVWYIVITGLLSVAYYYIKDPYDKMHLFEYFVLSFLFFRALHNHLYSKKLYVLGAVFSMIIAVIDETAQLFVANRAFSLTDIGADFTAALLGQLSITLIIKPKLETWRFKLKLKRTRLQEQKRWLSRRKF